MTDCAVEEVAILKLVARLAQASDDRDPDAYRACFADAIASGAPGETMVVPADDYVHDAMTRLKQTEWTHHRLVNPVVDVEPGGARAAASIDVVVELCRTDGWGARSGARLAADTGSASSGPRAHGGSIVAISSGAMPISNSYGASRFESSDKCNEISRLGPAGTKSCFLRLCSLISAFLR